MIITFCTWSCLNHEASPPDHFASALISSQGILLYFISFSVNVLVQLSCARNGARVIHIFGLDCSVADFRLPHYECCIAQVKQTRFQTPHESQFREDVFVARQQARLLLDFCPDLLCL